MAKFTSSEWDVVRKKFRTSIMVDTSLVSLAQNLETTDWPHTEEDEKPSKYIEFSYEELLLMPQIAGNGDKADHLIGILKETLAFDDPFGDLAGEVEQKAAKDNPILKTLARLNIPESFPLVLANFSAGTRMVCESEGIKDIGGFANLGQQMSTRVVLGGDFRNALNALTHGDEEVMSQFLPFRKGSTGLHLAEAIGLIPAGLPRADQLALAKFYGAKLNTADTAAAKTITKEQAEKLEAGLRPTVLAALDWFKDGKVALVQYLADGSTMARYFAVINDHAREAIAVRLVSAVVKVDPKAAPAASADEKKGGMFSRLFGKR